MEALERGNFFVVPLDGKRQGFRYHQLFADFLFAHLIAEQPDQVSALHQRASEWYEHNGSTADAIRHALAAADFMRAASLVELALPDLRRNRQHTTLLGWLKALPDALVQCRPVLSANYGGVLLASGQLESVEAHLRDAERWLDTSANTGKRPNAPTGERVIVVDTLTGEQKLPLERLTNIGIPNTRALALARQFGWERLQVVVTQAEKLA